MYVGTQNAVKTDDEYRQFAQLGVRHINADPDGNPHDWTLDDSEAPPRPHGSAAASSSTWCSFRSPRASSRNQQSPDILTKGPDRDRQIDSICRLIENVAAAGIPVGQVQPQHHRHPALA